MTKQEFQKRIGAEISQKDYSIVEHVYTWHPSISEVEGKEQIAELYKSFGMPIIKNMMEAANYAETLDRAMAQAQRQVTDITNELLRKNAETLHMATVETAKESERGIVDLETLQKTNADLIQTLDDVMRIQMEGRQKRQAAEMEMHRMEEELKRKLLEIR